MAIYTDNRGLDPYDAFRMGKRGQGMKRRPATLFVLALSLTFAVAIPGNAQGVYYSLELGRAAIAVLEDPAAQSFALIMAGEGVVHSADEDEPFVGEVGCASVENAERAAFACGELAAFTIDDDLGAATARATWDATVFEFETGKTARSGKISFSASWRSTSDPRPRTGGQYFLDGPFVHAATDAAIARDALGGTYGSVSATRIGRGPRKPIDAQILMGTSVGVVAPHFEE